MTMLKCIGILLAVLLVTSTYGEENNSSETIKPDSTLTGNTEPAAPLEGTSDASPSEIRSTSQMYHSQSLAVCSDSLYLALKRKTLENMTDREFQYFLLKEKLCCDSLLKDTRTEFVFKEESSKLYRTRNIVFIIGSSVSITVSVFSVIALMADVF